MYDKLKALAEKKTLTKKDKEYIVESSKELDIEFNPKAGCSNCHFDQIFKLIEKLKPIESKLSYKLKPKVKPFKYKGVLYSNETLTEKMISTMIEDGLGYWLIKK